MKYLLTIYIEEKVENAYTEADWERLDAGYAAFHQAALSKGAYVEGSALMPPSTATTLRVRQGKTLLTDGPFAETKEQMGGYFILDCPSLDVVIELANLMPGAQSNSVEIRAFAPEGD